MSRTPEAPLWLRACQAVGMFVWYRLGTLAMMLRLLGVALFLAVVMALGCALALICPRLAANLAREAMQRVL